MTTKSKMFSTKESSRSWTIIDAKDKVVGRLATKITGILRGKDKATFSPMSDTGNFVVVINATQLKFTGNKWLGKHYYSHTGFFGGLKDVTAEKMRERHPEKILYEAVWGMMPKNRLSKQLIRKLKIYPGAEHPHAAQQPASANV